MTDVDFQPPRRHELLAVYPDHETAERVLAELRAQLHEPGAHEGTDQDRRDSLNAEMGEEMRQSFTAPQAGIIYTKEAMKTGAWMMPLCVVLGIVVALPIAFMFESEVSTGGRIIAAVAIGAAMGGTVALILMSLGQKNPDEPMAAERGVTVRVPDDTDELRRVMIAAHPIRLDVVDDEGRPIETIAEEADHSADPETFDDRQKHWP